MGGTAPIRTKCWIKFLESKGCYPARGTNHTKWKCPGCLRSIIFDRGQKDIPHVHVRTNLKNMGFSIVDFTKWMDENC